MANSVNKNRERMMADVLTIERNFWDLVPVRPPAYPVHENLADASRCCNELLTFSRTLGIIQMSLSKRVLEVVKRLETFIYSTNKSSGKYRTRKDELSGGGDVNLLSARQIRLQRMNRELRLAARNPKQDLGTLSSLLCD